MDSAGVGAGQIERVEQPRKRRAISAQDRISRIDDVEAHVALIGIDHNLYRVANVTESVVGRLGIGKPVGDGVGILYPEQSPLVDDEIRIAIELQEGCTPRNTLLDRSPQLDAALRQEVRGQDDVDVELMPSE